MCRILFFSCEPGGAEVLIPVIKLLEEHEKYKLIVCGYSHALQRFDKAGIKYEKIIPIEKNDFSLFERYKPQLVITSATSLPYKDMSEKYLWNNAKHCNIPSIAFIDQWQNFEIRFSGIEDDERLVYQPDYINAINQDGIDEMINLGFDEKKLKKWGQPYLSSLKSQYMNIDRCSLQNIMGVQQKKVILFISEAIYENYSDDRGYNQYTVLDIFLSNIKDDQNSSVVIKLHPKDSKSKFDKILKKYSYLEIIVVTNEYSPIEVICLSDVIVGMTSIMLIEAYILGKPVLSFQPFLRIEDPLLLSRKNYIPKSYDDTIKLNDFTQKEEIKFEYQFKEKEFLSFLETQV